MTYLFIIIYSITLIYFAFTERVKKFVWLLVVQGLVLFGMVFFSLKETEIFNLIFILTETIVVKSIVVPWFLNRVRRNNGLKRVQDPTVPIFYSIIVIMLTLILSFILSNKILESELHTQFLSLAFTSIIYGFYFIVVHKNIFSHVVGYLIIENGIFMLSLAVGDTMPLLVNLAVLFDVVMGILVLGIFMNRVGNTFQTDEVHKLTELKD